MCIFCQWTYGPVCKLTLHNQKKLWKCCPQNSDQFSRHMDLSATKLHQYNKGPRTWAIHVLQYWGWKSLDSNILIKLSWWMFFVLQIDWHEPKAISVCTNMICHERTAFLFWWWNFLIDLQLNVKWGQQPLSNVMCEQMSMQLSTPLHTLGDQLTWIYTAQS